MFSRKNLLRILINSLIGLILIIFWIKLVNITVVLETLNKINIIQILPFLFIFMLSNILRALRLKILLSEFRPQLPNLIYLTYLSQLLSFTIPLRVGEITKAVYLSTEFDIKFPRAIIWVFLDRFLDFWAVLVMAAVLLKIVPTALPASLNTTLLFSVSVVSAIACLVIFYPIVVKRAVRIIKYKYFTQIVDFIIDSAYLLNKGFLKLSFMIILTVLASLSDSLGWFILIQAIASTKINFLSVYLGSLMSALTYLIPAAPGYVGSAEASSLAVFSFGLGLNRDLVSAAGVLYHILTIICILFLGLVSLYLLKFNLQLVWKKFKR